MPRIIVSAKAIIQKDGRILFVKQTRPGMHYWDLPGGKLEYGETLASAVKREVKEETSLDVSVGELAGVWQFFSPTNKHQVVCPTYVCLAQGTEVDISRNVATEFIKDYAWLSKQDVLRGEYHLLDSSLTDVISKL